MGLVVAAQWVWLRSELYQRDGARYGFGFSIDYGILRRNTEQRE